MKLGIDQRYKIKMLEHMELASNIYFFPINIAVRDSVCINTETATQYATLKFGLSIHRTKGVHMYQMNKMQMSCMSFFLTI